MAKSRKPRARIIKSLMHVSDLPDSFAGRTLEDAICHVEDKVQEVRDALLSYHGLEILLGLLRQQRDDDSTVPAGELKQMLTAFNNDMTRGVEAVVVAIGCVRIASQR